MPARAERNLNRGRPSNLPHGWSFDMQGSSYKDPLFGPTPRPKKLFGPWTQILNAIWTLDPNLKCYLDPGPKTHVGPYSKCVKSKFISNKALYRSYWWVK